MRFLMRSVLALIVLMALAAGLAALLYWQMAPLHGTISIGDSGIAVHGLGDLDSWQGAFGLAAGTVAVIGAVLVAMIAVVVGLSAAVVGIAIALIAVAGSLLAAAAPLLIVAGVVWLLVRQRRAPAAPAAAGVGA